MRMLLFAANARNFFSNQRSPYDRSLLDRCLGRLFFNKWRKKLKVYYEGRDDGHRMFVQPGTHCADVSEWMENDKPKLIEVKFTHGVADVPENLGKYLIDKGLAKKSRILLPKKRLH